MQKVFHNNAVVTLYKSFYTRSLPILDPVRKYDNRSVARVNGLPRSADAIGSHVCTYSRSKLFAIGTTRRWFVLSGEQI